jgi:DNA-binding transcriptional ArsR family regulator
VADIDEILRALGDPTRARLVELLLERDDQSLFELCTKLITVHRVSITRQAVSKHLAILRDAGIVQSEVRGRTTLHRLQPRSLDRVATWLDRLRRTSD